MATASEVFLEEIFTRSDRFFRYVLINDRIVAAASTVYLINAIPLLRLPIKPNDIPMPTRNAFFCFFTILSTAEFSKSVRKRKEKTVYLKIRSRSILGGNRYVAPTNVILCYFTSSCDRDLRHTTVSSRTENYVVIINETNTRHWAAQRSCIHNNARCMKINFPQVSTI